MTKHTSSNCDIPANNSINAITRNIAPNSLVIENLTSLIDELECKPTKHILNKGLRIHASKQISEYNIHIGSIHIFFPNVMPKFSHLKGKKALCTKLLCEKNTLQMFIFN